MLFLYKSVTNQLSVLLTSINIEFSVIIINIIVNMYIIFLLLLLSSLKFTLNTTLTLSPPDCSIIFSFCFPFYDSVLPKYFISSFSDFEAFVTLSSSSLIFSCQSFL